ncbi:MAG: SMP-30/gluconolactonase/LRE family protein [Acidobacteriaceae bacterium]
MRLFSRVVAAISIVLSLQAISHAQVAQSSMEVLRLAPALDQLVAPGVEPEVVSGAYVFTEGPMWRGGRLWFSDEEGDRVHAVTPDGRDTILVDFTHGPFARPNRQKTGPNAMATSKDGSVVMCEQYNRAVVRLVGQPSHLRPEPLFDSYRGKRLNSPNDLVFLPDGSFFFTDPPYGLKGGDHDPAKQLPFNGVFHYKNGKLTPIITNLTLPNGIALSPDNKTLYVNNSGPKERVIAYPLHADGTVGSPHDVIDFTGKEGPGVPDGMKIDSRGDIWTTGPGGIRILTPAGKVLGRILLPEVAANLAWGGDGSTLYITARTHVYRLQTLVHGNLPAFRR